MLSSSSLQLFSRRTPSTHTIPISSPSLECTICCVMRRCGDVLRSLRSLPIYESIPSMLTVPLSFAFRSKHFSSLCVRRTHFSSLRLTGARLWSQLGPRRCAAARSACFRGEASSAEVHHACPRLPWRGLCSCRSTLEHSGVTRDTAAMPATAWGIVSQHSHPSHSPFSSPST